LLPPFIETGDLPYGIHRATLRETIEHFGTGTPKRRVNALRLERIYRLAAATAQLRRFVVFGSFVTTKSEPNDIDVFMLMEDTFDAEQLLPRKLVSHAYVTGFAIKHLQTNSDLRFIINIMLDKKT